MTLQQIRLFFRFSERDRARAGRIDERSTGRAITRYAFGVDPDTGHKL